MHKYRHRQTLLWVHHSGFNVPHSDSHFHQHTSNLGLKLVSFLDWEPNTNLDLGLTSMLSLSLFSTFTDFLFPFPCSLVRFVLVPRVHFEVQLSNIVVLVWSTAISPPMNAPFSRINVSCIQSKKYTSDFPLHCTEQNRRTFKRMNRQTMSQVEFTFNIQYSVLILQSREREKRDW